MRWAVAAIAMALLALAAPAGARSDPTAAVEVAAAAAPVVTAVRAELPQQRAVRRCSAGLVALTFDDGPARGLTADLVRTLRERRVPATFFMVGSRVRTAPRAARAAAAAGFTIGNHTWSHPDLTRLTDAAVRAQLRSTARELRAQGIRPSTLVRPPYGAVDDRVRRDVLDLGLVPVLWDVDSRDWRGGSAGQIADAVLRQLRPHRRNIVLQHDGVRNSPASVAAVPRIVRDARHRGYCFATIGPRGTVRPPVPTLRVRVASGAEAGPTPARVVLRLSSPTSRRVSVRVRTDSGTATAGADFTAASFRVTFPVGTTRAVVDVPVLDDGAHEPTETFRVLLDRPDGLHLPRRPVVGTIVSDDPPLVTRLPVPHTP